VRWNGGLRLVAASGLNKGVDYLPRNLALIVSPMGSSMTGRWLGFDKEFKVNTGEWRLDWLEEARAVRSAV